MPIEVYNSFPYIIWVYVNNPLSYVYVPQTYVVLPYNDSCLLALIAGRLMPVGGAIQIFTSGSALQLQDNNDHQP